MSRLQLRHLGPNAAPAGGAADALKVLRTTEADDEIVWPSLTNRDEVANIAKMLMQVCQDHGRGDEWPVPHDESM